jgi:hypothetical protein
MTPASLYDLTELKGPSKLSTGMWRPRQPKFIFHIPSVPADIQKKLNKINFNPNKGI